MFGNQKSVKRTKVQRSGKAQWGESLKGSVQVQCQKTRTVLEFQGRSRLVLTRGWEVDGRGRSQAGELAALNTDGLQTVNEALQWEATCVVQSGKSHEPRVSESG